MKKDVVGKRITLLVTGLGRGGAEIQVVQLATRLKSRAWDVQVVSMLPLAELAADLAKEDVPVAALNMKKGVADPSAIFRLTSLLRAHRPLVLHGHMVHANLLARAARPLARVPVLICTAHNVNEGARWRELAYRITDPLCDLTTNVGAAAAARYVRVGAAPKSKIRALPNGIDTQAFRPDASIRVAERRALGLQDAFVWLAVGRLDEAKDYPTMLQAFSEVVKNFPVALLLVAGAGPLEGEVKHLAVKLGLEKRVRFLGLRQDTGVLMNAADAFILSSAWEGMPLALLEASATGLPVVATAVGGVPEIVVDEESGFLTPPEDPAALAHAAGRIMTMPEEERKRMGEAGRAHVEASYSLEHVVSLWEGLYTELLTRKGIL